MQLELTPDTLHIRLTFWERVWSLHGSFRLPRDAVVSASDEAIKPRRDWMRLRACGTYVPRCIMAGGFWKRGGLEFWYVTRSSWNIGLVIELRRGWYKRLVLGVQDAEGWARRTRAWLEQAS